MLLGLDRENVRRLQDGRPIVVDLDNYDMEGRDITDERITRVVIFDGSEPRALETLWRRAPQGPD